MGLIWGESEGLARPAKLISWTPGSVAVVTLMWSKHERAEPASKKHGVLIHKVLPACPTRFWFFLAFFSIFSSRAWCFDIDLGDLVSHPLLAPHRNTLILPVALVLAADLPDRPRLPPLTR